MKKSDYRPDIDGLRALAVLSVLFYHLEFNLFKGGYIGVDIFFVISGYLITNIIRNQLRSNTFSLKVFYIRRINRLYPVLLFTICLCFLIAGFLFTPEYFERLAKSSFSAIFSFSNFFFWSESGYFDSTIFYKPLLHTWSLGVEEQFYLLWPALLIFVFHFKESNHLYLLLILLSISIVASITWSSIDQPATFYLTPFRIVEFSIGAVIVWSKNLQPENKLILEITYMVGILMIIYSATQFSAVMLFPGTIVLIPCIGTALCIYSGKAKYSPKILNNSLMVYIGLISYSLYLIHWPIISFYQYYFLHKPIYSHQFIIVSLSLFLASLMYHFIENPFRIYGQIIKYKHIQRIQAYSLIAVLFSLLVLNVISNRGWGWRYEGYSNINNSLENKQQRFFAAKEACHLENYDSDERCKLQQTTQVLIIGNSHEIDGFNIFNSAYEDITDINFILFGGLNNCEIIYAELPVYSSSTGPCANRIKKLTSNPFRSKLTTVIYSSNKPFAYNKKPTLDLLEKIKSKNPQINIIILGGYINTTISCSELAIRFGGSKMCKKTKWVSYFPGPRSTRYLGDQLFSLGYFYLDKVKLLCKNNLLKNCLTETKDKIPFTYDSHHLSYDFAVMTGELIRSHYPELLDNLRGNRLNK